MTASHPTIETVAVVGAGAMGAMYADHFGRAGLQTFLVAHGDRAVGLRALPITVNGGVLNAEVLDPLEPVLDSRAIPPVGLILVAVNHAGLDEAIELIAPITTILSVLNGLESEGIILGGLREARSGTTPDQVPLCIALAWTPSGWATRCATPRPADSSSDRRRPPAPKAAATAGRRRFSRLSPGPGSPGPPLTTCATRCGGSSWATRSGRRFRRSERV